MSLASFPGTSDATSNIGSGGELESPLVPWLGPPNQMQPLNIDIEGKNPHVTHNLPLAFWGKSKAMETLVEFRVTSKSEWYTTDLMPWEQSEDLNLSWTVLQYKKSYFEVEPYGGNPNYIESSIEGYSDKMIQRGMAFTIAHGFWKTEMGKQQYKMNFEVLESSAQLTVYHLIIMSILRAKNVYRNFELKFKSPATTIPQALKRLKIRWAILNKGMDEFRKFHADLVEVMERNGVKPNLWALPPKSKILMTHAHKSETEYSSAGELAIRARQEGQRAVDTFRGLKVFETTVFNEVMFGQLFNPLRRLREYGSFHWITNYLGGAHLSTYRNEDRFAAKILDAAKDGQETKVSGGALFKLCTRFDADGSLSRYHKQLIQDNKLGEMKRRLGGKHDDHYIDMFIGYDPTRDPQNPYYVMEYLGEQWDMNVTRSQIRDFAITANNKLRASLTPEEYQAVDESDNFMDGITRVDPFGKYKYYLAALALSGTIDGGENKSTNDLFKNNGSGCVMPPIVDKANGLSILINGRAQPLVFFENAQGRILAAIPAATLYAQRGDNASTHGLPLAPDAGGDVQLQTAMNTQTLVLNGGHRIGGAAGGKVVKSLDDFEPLGFGHPAGLRTLSKMYLSKDHRGYSESTLQRSHLHYTAMRRAGEVFNKIFPNHELTEDRACPFYFRSDNTLDNRITAFGLNLYNHVKYPVFAIAPAAVGQGYTWGRDPNGANAELSYQRGASWLWDPIRAQINPLNLAGSAGAIERRFDLVSKIGQSGIVNQALADPKTKERLDKNYRGKVYKDGTRTYGLYDFLAYVLYNGDVNNTKDQQAVNAFVTVLEILLRDNLDTPVEWAQELERSKDRVVKIRGLGQQALPPVTAVDHRKAFNTRICLDPAAFRAIAEVVEAHDPDNNAGKEATAASLNTLQFLRPMNIFNPTQPLGLVDPAGVVNTGIMDQGAIQGTGDGSLKALAQQLKFASAPNGRNTVSSLTTSAVFASHLDASKASSTTTLKRSLPGDLYDGSSSIYPAKRNRLVGGVAMSHNFDYVDAPSARNRLVSAIPGAKGAYSGSDDMVITGEPSIPANIALDAAYHVFSFNGTHQDVGGAVSHQRIYRTKLVERFHDLAQETENKIRIFAQGWATQRITRQAFEAFWANDCIPLVSFGLWRIRQRYYMGSGFMAEGGSRLGNAFHGFHDFQWSDDIIRKVHVGHYTFNVCCPVKDPKKFALVEDMVAMGYRSGEDVSFIQSPEDFHTLCQDPDNAPGSILVKMTPYNRELPASPQDVGGRWNPAVAMQVSTDGLSGDNPHHGESVFYYNFVYGLDRLNGSLVLREPVFHNPTMVINTIAWRAHHRLYDPVSGKWELIILDDGKLQRLIMISLAKNN